tara:strand:+ start:326 stop:835 length:510 start_codon:yes stop_codon:yes gene_type:complete
MVVDAFLVYHFIKRLVTPFEKMPAFKMGLIDKNGNFLKRRREFDREEKKSLQMFDVMLINLKKLIAKIPGGKTRIATIAAALYLLRSTPAKNIKEDIDLDDLFEMEIAFRNIMNEVENVLEDASPPINTTSGVAGLTPDSIGVPVKMANKYKKKNQDDIINMLKIIKRK